MIVELGLSCGLLVGAGLMIRTIVELEKMNFAFATEDVLTMRVTLDDSEYGEKESRVAFASEVVAKLRTSPGVEAVALTSHLPGMGSGGANFILEGTATPQKDRGTEARFAEVSPDFFDTFGVRLLAGRPFRESDDSDLGAGGHREPELRRIATCRARIRWADGFEYTGSGRISRIGRSSAWRPTWR